jgi:tetratricopeptide (TPR) repeat protein
LLRQNTDITATLQLIERINEREMDQTRTLDADGEVESLLRRLLATAPQRTQPGIAWELATMLRSQDRPHDAQIVLDGTFPPIRLPTAEIAAPPLPAPEPIDPRYTITGSMSETFAAAISAQNQARPIEEQRDLWLAALATGERPGLALPAALAALVRSGQNVAAIEAYMNVAEAAYPSGSAAWNLACALAGVGDYELAVSWFTYSFEVGATDLSDGRRQLRDAIFARVGVAPPRTAPDLQVPTSGTLTEAQFLEATKQLAEEFKTKAIDVETARVRLAQLTDRARPSEPTRLQSARLMLEFGQSAEAFDRLATMMRAGVSDLQSGSRLLTLAACATDREPEAAEILERHADVHYVCLDIARLCNQLRQLEHAIQWAQRAVDIKPSYLESAHYLEILQQTGAGPEIRGQSNADASVVFAGLRADGSVELIVSVVTDDAIQDAEIVTDQKTFWIGDIGADTSCVIPVTSDSNSAIKKLTFAWVSEGRAAEQDVEIPDPVTPGPITLPFDPTQPANSRLFVGRESEIEWLTSHYRSHTQVLFISGPRQVGKTSIVRQLRLKSRLDTGLPLVVIMEGDVYQKEHSFLTQVSDAIMVELNKSSLECPPAPSIDRVADFNLWMIKSVRPLIGDRVLLIALDEVQRVLDACTEEGSGDSRESIAGNIRTLSSDTDLRVRFLLLGSCTYSSVRDRLEHTTLAAEILERQIGFLDRRDTRELVTRGFEQADGGATYVAESAHEAFWELTAGYPNHVHLLGQRVGVLLNNSHQRSVDWEIVEAAAERLVQDGTRAVDHFVGREAKSSSQEHVLVKLAEYFGNNEGIDAAPSLFELTREIGTEHQDGIVRLVRLGLLREEPDGTVHVANGLVKSWLVRNAYLLSTSRQLRASSVEYTPFKERGFEVNPGRPDGIGQRLVLKTQGAVYLARSLHLSGEPPRPITTAGQSLDSVGLFDQRLERWVVLTHAEGEALDYYLEGLDSENWELSDTRKVVQAVSDTMATLSRCRDDCRCNHGKWVHGNLTPARIITRAQRGVFIAELALGADDQQTELTQLERDIYRPPEQLQRWKDKKGFKESDDVFALGVILTVTLREDHQPPYPETSDGVSDTSATEDSEIWVPRKWRTGVDKNLLRVITSMCKADLTERSSLDVARSSLTKWIDQL